MREDAGGIREMQMRRSITMFAKDSDGLIEATNLIESQRLARVVVSRGKVRHQTVNAYVTKTIQRANELAELIVTNAQPTHACVDLDMHIRYHIGGYGCLVECLKHIEPIND